MDRYIVDLLLNEDDSPFNSKNFKIIEFEENDNEKVYNLFNKVYGENVSIIFIDSGFGVLTFINDNMMRQVDLYIMLQSLSVIYEDAIDVISILFGKNASLLTVCNKPAPVTHDKNSSGDINTYIIKDSSSGLFKIGKSRNPIERLKTLSIGNPHLSIIGVCNKNVELLKNFMNDKGKISPARVTGLDAKIQRKIAAAIKRSRQIALLPYTKIDR